MDEALELAAKLSRAIARTARFRDLRKAEAAVMENEETLQALRRRDVLLTRIQEKSRKGEPIEPEEKHELAALDQAVKTNPALAELSRAQADFQELMNRVNEQITSALEPPARPAEDAAAEVSGEEPAAG